MGFRFRKSIRLLPGVRVNFSRSGASLTAGIRGASINFGQRGTYANVGIPGTGVSYRTRIGNAIVGAQSPAGSTLPAPSRGLSRRHWVGIAVFLLFGGLFLASGRDPAREQPAALVASEALTTAAPVFESNSVAIEVLPPPAGDSLTGTPISKDRIAALQLALRQLGFETGASDGVAGSKTIAAVKLFQMTQGREATGIIDAKLVDDVVAEMIASRDIPSSNTAR